MKLKHQRFYDVIGILAVLVAALVIMAHPAPSGASDSGIDTARYRCPVDAMTNAPTWGTATYYRACQDTTGTGSIVLYRSLDGGNSWTYFVPLFGTLPPNTPMGMMSENGRVWVFITSYRSFDFGTTYYKSAPANMYPTNALNWDDNWHPINLETQYR